MKRSKTYDFHSRDDRGGRGGRHGDGGPVLPEPLIQGLVLEEDGRPVGYHYMCIGYSAEVGGRYLLLDELYLAPECRGKGYGEQVIRWAMEQHPECARYRLEVTGENRAARLYERMGFRYLDYKQMVIDR